MSAAGEPAFEDLTARARIRDAAIQLFAEHGIAATTIRGIAKAARVSEGLVRHHFGSQDDLRDVCEARLLLQGTAQPELAPAALAALDQLQEKPRPTPGSARGGGQ